MIKYKLSEKQFFFNAKNLKEIKLKIQIIYFFLNNSTKKNRRNIVTNYESNNYNKRTFEKVISAPKTIFDQFLTLLRG